MVKEENTKQLRKYLKWNDNKNKTSELVGGSQRSDQKKRFIALNHIRKEQRHKINDLIFHLKKLEKEKQSKSKISRKKK